VNAILQHLSNKLETRHAGNLSFWSGHGHIQFLIAGMGQVLRFIINNFRALTAYAATRGHHAYAYHRYA